MNVSREQAAATGLHKSSGTGHPNTDMRKRTDGKGGSVPFSAEDFKYSLEEFLSSGHDDHGQSVRLFFRCPPQLERALEVILHARAFPYATVTDIIRHGVIRHAEWLHRLEPAMPRHFLSGLNAINEICRDAEMLSNIQQTFSKVDALIEGYLAKGEILEAQRLLSSARGQMAKLPDSRWKREFTERFTRKYARHITGGAGAGAGVGMGNETPATADTGRVLEFPCVASGGLGNDEGVGGPGETEDESYPYDED
jgi:hypothetical protein